ncbi:hypothetical protein GCM10009069_03960 [Algimonas arctica]|uniref:Uncharacterized protein n=1 Tax=Algimonas arctica TaxID=1479486 RepID=A0A8J3CPY3_9PROT|nr:hypothetical protein [Algimonas arctica]GHA83852.1 hypothetical protein GCM10009069_03960 [Algimonas arctica]
MFTRHTALAILAASVLSACASVDLPDIDFMGKSDFNEEISALNPDYASPDEVPDIPNDVRSASEWDKSAREMQDLYGEFEVPDLEPALTPEEFDRQFEQAQDASGAYKQDDPS